MMTDLEAFFCQNEIYDVKTIMSEQRLEGKFIFLVSTPFSLVVGGWVNHEVASIWLKISKQVAYG